jgi:hypothetical protein
LSIARMLCFHFVDELSEKAWRIFHARLHV